MAPQMGGAAIIAGSGLKSQQRYSGLVSRRLWAGNGIKPDVWHELDDKGLFVEV